MPVLFEAPTGYLDKLHAHVTDLQVGAGYPAHIDEHDVAIVVFAGTVRTGAVVSVTVTVKDADAWFACASVAAHVTVVGPNGNVVPLAGAQVTGTVPSRTSSIRRASRSSPRSELLGIRRRRALPRAGRSVRPPTSTPTARRE